MSLGKRTADDGFKMYVLKPKNKDGKGTKVDPYFEVNEKVNGEWKEIAKEDTVHGDLTKIDIKEQEYNGNKYKTVALILVDKQEKEKYLVDLRFSMPTRSLYNMLVSLTDNFSGLSLSYYEKDGYDRYSLRQNGNFVNWKYKTEQLPKPNEVTFKGVVQRDYTPIDDLFEKELRELAVRVAKANSASHSEASAPATPAPAPTAESAADAPPF